MLKEKYKQLTSLIPSELLLSCQNDEINAIEYIPPYWRNKNNGYTHTLAFIWGKYYFNSITVVREKYNFDFSHSCERI